MKRTIYAVFALLMFAACKQQQPLPEPVIDNIEVDDDSYVLDYKAQTISLNFATNAEYQFEIGADWIVHVDEESRSMESYNEHFAVAENSTSDERSTYIKIIAGDVEYMVTVVQGARPELFNLSIKHCNEHLDSPVWMGENVRGSIDWGDGDVEEYAEGASHNYATAGSHSAKFEMESADGFEIDKLGDIEHLDIAF
jgi:hypothetical protein